MIKKVQRVTSIPKSCSYEKPKQEQILKKESTVNGDFGKVFAEELKKLR